MQPDLTRRAFFAHAARVLIPHSRVSPVDEPAFTPTSDFYRVLQPTPDIQVDYWSLAVGGLVRHPLVWSYDDLLALPAEEIACTLVCAAHTPREPRIGHARWRGVPLRLLLAQLDIDPAARHARLSAAGGHTTTIPLARLETALLAYAMNGETLLPEHGFPARLIVPGLYDHKQPRWIQRADLTAAPVPGAWERRGWRDEIQPTAALLEPRDRQPVRSPVRLRGCACAGEQDIATLEISIDGGDPLSIPFEPPPPHTWARWQIDWTAPAPGDYRVHLRITAAQGGESSCDHLIRVIDS